MNTEADIAFGKRLKVVRQSRKPKVTTRALSALVDKSSNYISRIEAGERTVDLHSIQVIAAALKVKPMFLLKGVFDAATKEKAKA